MDTKRLQETFFNMVEIYNPSRHEAELAKYCEATLKELGFSVRFDNSQEASGSEIGNLIAYLPGTTTGHIVLSAHMDSVEPCEGVVPVISDGVIHSAGDTVLGTDDKAGIAAIFEAVQSVLEKDLARPSITVLFTVCEELSLLGAGGLADDVFADEVPCFVFDADGKPGTIIIGSPFHYSLDAQFSGKAAHAGVEPEAGISAIQMAACAIEAMNLGRIDKDTTASIGIIEGGHEVNVIPDFCQIRGECRSLFSEKVEICREQMTRACEQAAEKFGGEVAISWRLDYPGVLYEKDDPLVSSVVRAAKQAGLEPQFAISGGGADTNIFNSKGARAITLGLGMQNFHSTDERISVKDLEDSALFCEAIITEFA